jgi:hypothetical protein
MLAATAKKHRTFFLPYLATCHEPASFGQQVSFGMPSFRRFQNLDPFHGAVHEFYGSGTNVSQLRVNCASGEVLSQMMHEIIGVSNEPTGLEAERSSIFFLEHALILSSN